MKKGSIALNLFLISSAWLVIALVATAFLLTELYARALDTSLEETLVFHLDTLDGLTIAGQVDDPDSSLADPRFNAPLSGWYWQVREESAEIVAISPSLIGTLLPTSSQPFDQSGTRSMAVEDSFGTQIRLLERRVLASGKRYVVSVTGNLDEIYELVGDFRGQALIVLGAVGLMLAIMSAIVGRIALRPVARLRSAVEAVRAGEAREVEGLFPTEIAPLAEEVNELMRSNSQIIERARNQVGNLAHGLKTPIAVLRNEAAGKRTEMGKIVLTETEKMSGIVSTYLDRARLAARTSVIGKSTNVKEALPRLVRVMDKIFPDTDISCSIEHELPDFRGEEADFEEMIGNLLDNACKWSNARVQVAAKMLVSDTQTFLVVRIEDDGPGLAPEAIEQALRRGVRLDEKKPGSGLGLDIVKELVDVYGGRLELGSAPLGGLSVELILPATRIQKR